MQQAQFEKRASVISHARIGTELDLRDAEFTELAREEPRDAVTVTESERTGGDLNMVGVEVGQSILMQGATVDNVSLSRAKIDGQLNMDRSTINGPVLRNGP